jgi:sec-independent protein translocase protein TatB
MLNIGPQELLLVLIIALLVVGPQRLPELSRQIGKGLREFRKVQDDVKGLVKLDLDEPAASTPGGRQRPPTGSAVHRTPRPAPAPPAVATSPEAAATANGTPPAPGDAEPSPPSATAG